MAALRDAQRLGLQDRGPNPISEVLDAVLYRLERAGAVALDTDLPDEIVTQVLELKADPDRAEAVVKAAGSKGSIVLVDHIHLYSAAWEALKLEAQALGPLRAIATVAGNWGPFRADVPMLWDWGPHDVAMCIDFLGRPPEKVTARLIESRETEEGPGEVLALGLGFGDVTAAAAISNLQTEKTRLFTAVFEKGELVYDDMSEEKLRLRTDPQDPGGTFRLGDGTPLERAVMAFRDAIFKKSPDMKDAVMGRDVVRVLAEMDRQLG